MGKAAKTLVGVKKKLHLPNTTTPQAPPAPSPPKNNLLDCAPPSARTGPVFELSLRRPILSVEAGDQYQQPSDVYAILSQAVPLSGTSFFMRDAFFGLDARF